MATLQSLNGVSFGSDETLELAQEAVTDSLLNIVFARISGWGDEGSAVYGERPSRYFKSGFLLPRYNERHEDDTNFIHNSNIGIDFQVRSESRGTIRVIPNMSVYVRALPEWEELLDALRDRLFFTLDEELEQDLRERSRTIRSELMQAGNINYREASDQAFQQAASELGVEISNVQNLSAVAGNGNSDTSTESYEDTGLIDDIDVDTDLAGYTDEDIDTIETEAGPIFTRLQDDQARDRHAPAKWIRITFNELPAFEIDLAAEPERIANIVSEYNQVLNNTIADNLHAWLRSPEGMRQAFRPAILRPSNVENRENYIGWIEGVRQLEPNPEEVLPYAGPLSIYCNFVSDFVNPELINVRIMIEHIGHDRIPRDRLRFDEAIHQVSLTIRLPETAHHQMKLDRVDPSYRYNPWMQQGGLGINCGISASLENDESILTTTWFPRYRQPRVDSLDTTAMNIPTDFNELGGDPDVDFDPSSLYALTESFDSWILDLENQFNPENLVDPDDRPQERAAFNRDLESWRSESQRINRGIDLLVESYNHYNNGLLYEASPYLAFRLLNRTIIAAGQRKGITNWRLFQLAFILAHIPTLSSRIDAFQNYFDADFDELTATLLYFPTGGGKSEAFLGLLIFAMFLDRLRGKHRGITAIVRYPLRLLTLQQAQRALLLVCYAEIIRQAENIPGEPFLIGFWAGKANTPNSIYDDRIVDIPTLDDALQPIDGTVAFRRTNLAFNKVPVCPMCGNNTQLRLTETSNTDGEREALSIICFSENCEWNLANNGNMHPLPFLLIDRDIYRRAPTILLGVIDKIALIGNHMNTIRRVLGMFGLARWYHTATSELIGLPLAQRLREDPSSIGCDEINPSYQNGRQDLFYDPIPSLLIQDEAHLLEESLGTFSAIFDTTLEAVFRRIGLLIGSRAVFWPGSQQLRLPKVIAATATISHPERQVNVLYQRNHRNFPHPGPNLYESFYARLLETSSENRRRLCTGSTIGNEELQVPWMRVYSSIITNGATHTMATIEILSKLHALITELFDSLSNNDSNIISQAISQIRNSLDPEDPITSLRQLSLDDIVTNDRIDALLSLVDLYRIVIVYVTNKKGGDQISDAIVGAVENEHRRLRSPWEGHFRQAMITGGIDAHSIQETMEEAERDLVVGEEVPDVRTLLRQITATSAVSHGVDVDRFNAMIFAGLPNDIAEYIQASSRIGRRNVGFSLLIPTPHVRRDRYAVETHTIFHRFLERMIDPPAVERWADFAIRRAMVSLFQAWLGLKDTEAFSAANDKARAPNYGNYVSARANILNLTLREDDFVGFVREAVGINGRSGIGAALQTTHYENIIAEQARHIFEAIRQDPTGTGQLHDFWQMHDLFLPPMTSLRDVEENGVIRPSIVTPSGRRLRGGEEAINAVNSCLREIRRQRGIISEIDDDNIL